MYYRRKVALALLQCFDGKLGKIEFQKLLFLLAQTQKKPIFEFVPYKYGCFSFQANADMRTMITYGQVQESISSSSAKPDTWHKLDTIDYLNLIELSDRVAIEKLKLKFGAYSTKELIEYTYRQFPYYAINSTIGQSILGKEAWERRQYARSAATRPALFSIGYEGLSLEGFLNKLLANDIKLLCDVRKNSKSMKFGFSKNQLQNGCQGVGIEFVHLPNLGIDSEKRKTLSCQADYDALFEEYNATTLVAEESHGVKELTDLVAKYQRVAVTCFEANIDQCHRKHLALKVASLPDWKHEIIHLT